MNYFPFHIGDYAAHTSHLEPMEDLAYMRLLKEYYLREGPLPADIQVTAKLVRMRSMVADVESVLKEFFMLTDKGWAHERCETEIAHMQDKQAKARASAAASVKSRQAFAAKKLQTSETPAANPDNGRSTSVEISPADVELPTPTPTPVINTPIPPKGAESGSISAKQRTPAVSLTTWLESIKASGEKPIPEDDPVFAYADETKIPHEYLRLCWREFRGRYSQKGAKRYSDWRKVFRGAVRGNWLKLWWIDGEGSYALTTCGKQAEMAARQ